MKKVTFVESDASVLLDLLRGTAAILVVLEHWRNFLFVDYPQLAGHRLWYALPYLLCSAGHQAVVIFFVLSGYLVSGSVFRMLGRGTWSWAAYSLHRLSRLWIVLLPGLLLCLLWDTVGIRSGLAPALYHGAGLNHMTENVSRSLGAKLFVQNLVFLQGFRVHTFGSDGALWSLSNEFWYYVLFPLALLALHPRTGFRARTACIVLFVLTAKLVWGGVLMEFPIWLTGTLLCLVPTPRLGKGARMLAWVVYLPLLFFFARQRIFPLSALVGDYLLTGFTSVFLWVLLSARGQATASPGERASRAVARFSYTLYVVHMPFLVLLTALVAGDGRWVPTLPHNVAAVGLLALVVAYAYGVASLTEFRTDAWRAWVERRLGVRRHDTSTVATRT